MDIASVVSISEKFLVDMVPNLKHIPEWMPGASFQKLARESKLVTGGSADIAKTEAP